MRLLLEVGLYFLESFTMSEPNGGISMIIKRLAEQFRSQNWFALGAELIVVVVGIFLGLQADSWHKKHGQPYLSAINQLTYFGAHFRRGNNTTI